LEEHNKNERLSAREFCRLEKLIKDKMGIREIAKLMDRSPSSISRHVNNKENWDWFRQCGVLYKTKKVVKRFSAAIAIKRQKEKKKGRGRIPKVAKDFELRQFLEESIKKKKWSPQIALGYAEKHGLKFTETVSVKTVYNSIYRHDLDISLFDLFLKLRRKPTKERITRMWKRTFGKRIDERPDISNRLEFGHWEIDTVLWGRECSILVLVERKTRYCKLIKLNEHTSEEVNKKLSSIVLPITTLTADNGSEFAKLAQLIENTYFTHPYSAWEKGSVENLNSLIRRYLPRNTPIDKITDSRLCSVESAINNRPRPILDFATSAELYLLNAI
jgi:IS30 family transposase